MKFKTIYADCPWKYSDSRTHKSTGMALSAYPTMKLKDLKELPVQDLADDPCMLVLWATMPKLKEAFAVIDAWGFQYITCGFTWLKLNPTGSLEEFLNPESGKTDFILRGGVYSGLGHWTNGNQEIVLFARKGRPVRKVKNVKQPIISPRREHSRKPDEIYGRIEALLESPYLELFARHTRPGWTSIGDGVTGEDIRDSIKDLAEQ